MEIGSRRVKEVLNSGTQERTFKLDELRTIPAWILLGEPGSGKTYSFEEEAKISNGSHLTIAEFITLDGLETEKDQILFLDGLDEIRASGDSHSLLLQVRTKLKKLGNPFFRISCRSADWYGQSDRNNISDASQNKQLRVFNLLPLSEADILKILDTLGVNEPDTFIRAAKTHGISDLYGNPQLLKMIATVWKAGSWPDTREKIFELFCKTQAKEPNKRHRDQKRTTSHTTDDLLDASGYLFATMLLSDKSGVALDDDKSNKRYPTLDSYKPPKHQIAETSLRSAIFTPAHSEEQLTPNHRSIAEYLASRWLAKQIETKGLPLGRILNLLLGYDHKTVAGLRGLYAWLAVHSLKARTRLIETDPVTVLLYGDVQSMPLPYKKSILEGIKKESQNLRSALLWELYDATLLNHLYDKNLEPQFIEILQSTARDDAAQTYSRFVLNVIEKSALSPELTQQLKIVATDDSYWESNRKQALKIWLNQATTCIEEKKNFLDMLQNGKINDPNDELAGYILNDIYAQLGPKEFIQYLHPPKISSLLGMYKHAFFSWTENINIQDLPFLLDHFTIHTDFGTKDKFEFLDHIVGKLLTKGIEIYGESISDEQLFSWLLIGVDQYGGNLREEAQNETLRIWINAHPTRYKGLLRLCFTSCEGKDNPLYCLYRHEHIFVGATVPTDTGLWHFQQIDQTKNLDLAKEHFDRAMRTIFQKNTQGLTLEMIEKWVGTNSVRQTWLNEYLVCKIPDRKWGNLSRKDAYREDLEKKRHERTVDITNKIDTIKAGTADPGTLYELAGVWNNHYPEMKGETVLERFKNYCNNPEEVYEAAMAGFCKCIYRADLPFVSDIVALYVKEERHYYLMKPCLVGLEIIAHDDMALIDLLNEDILKRMICFRLTDIGEGPAWFFHLVKTKPMLVSGVLFEYASAALKAKKDHIEGIYPLVDNPYYQEIAKIVVPKLLKSFPPLSKSSQLDYLECLLKAGLKYELVELAQIIKTKISLKRLDVSQRVYWLIAGMLMAPEKYEKKLWLYIENTWQRASLFSKFIERRMDHLYLNVGLTAYTLGKLIELLTPKARLDWPLGGVRYITDEERLGDQVKELISKLAGLDNQESLLEINRLLGIQPLKSIQSYLDNAKRELIQRLREKEFSFPKLEEVAQILANKAPTSPADLLALTLFHLDDIAENIRGSNANLFEKFWNQNHKRSPKDENSCRNVLLESLSDSLRPLGINCEKEAACFNDKRADIRVSFSNIELPIEIKGEWNRDLWTAVTSQVNQYTKSKKTGGVCIYLVLWFGGHLQKPPKDGGKRPPSPIELEHRLSAMVPQENQGKIHVRVIDVSWP